MLVETDHADGAWRWPSGCGRRSRRTRSGSRATTFPVTVSVGVATTCGERGTTRPNCCTTADGRLYAAKRAGRNGVFGEADGANLSITHLAK